MCLTFADACPETACTFRRERDPAKSKEKKGESRAFDSGALKSGELKINQVGTFKTLPDSGVHEYVAGLGRHVIPTCQTQLVGIDLNKIDLRTHSRAIRHSGGKTMNWFWAAAEGDWLAQPKHHEEGVLAEVVRRLVRPAGLEPAASWFVARRSIQLS